MSSIKTTNRKKEKVIFSEDVSFREYRLQNPFRRWYNQRRKQGIPERKEGKILLAIIDNNFKLFTSTDIDNLGVIDTPSRFHLKNLKKNDIIRVIGTTKRGKTKHPRFIYQVPKTEYAFHRIKVKTYESLDDRRFAILREYFCEGEEQ